MPIFEYKALTTAGGTRNGIIDADSPKDARAKLRRDKLLVTSLKETRSARAPTLSSRIRRLQGINTPNKKRTEQVAAVTRQMASLLASGIPLAEALRAVVEQAPDRQIESVFRDIRERVTQGMSFGDALSLHPAYFTELYSAMVKAGEASGALDAVLLKLADYLQAQARLRNRVGAAMIYPTIMVIVGILVVTVLMTFVVPKISQMMKSRGKELPLPTQILITVSDFLQNYWFLMALAVIALSLAFNWLTRLPKGRLFWDKFKLRLPVFGDLILKQAVARFSTTFSTLLRSGVPAIQAIQVTKDTLDNRLLTNALQKVHDHIVEGADIATPIRVSNVFPPVVSYMIAVGEQAGNLEDVLEQISSNYDEEVEIATQKLTAVIEPLIIVFLAVVVAAIILSIVLPLLQLQQVS